MFIFYPVSAPAKDLETVLPDAFIRSPSGCQTVTVNFGELSLFR